MGDLDRLEIRYAAPGSPVRKSVTLGDRLRVRVQETSGEFFERIPLVVGKDDTVRWIGGDAVAAGSVSGGPDVSGVVVNRGGRSVEIRWTGAAAATLWSSAFPVAGGSRTLRVLDLEAAGELAYDVRVVDDACPGSDERATVRVGGLDTGVANADDGTG